jgi:acyl-[acyl-carrier-protein]-phospholipid O-acyltransferase/long-chain-fatty-acid--[acyl-carrier-protein] ligase
VTADDVPGAVASQSQRASIYRDRSFWGLVATQFLGAFNDNVFKQLMLLLAVPITFASASASSASSPTGSDHDQQGLATIIFSLPFVLFSGYAGYLSDRWPKPTIITLCKLAEIVIMAFGMAAFLAYPVTGYSGLLVVLFLMGAHSAFFGPGKYGILPELFRDEDLPRANGFILMTTFLAIILGTALAGWLGDVLMGPTHNPAGLWRGSFVCLGIAVVGTGSSLLIRRLSAVDPRLAFHWDTVAIPHETWQLLRRDAPLRTALAVSCVFWLISGIAMQGVNSLGLVQLELNKTWTSIMTATIGLGIAAGAVLAGKLSAGRANFRLVTIGGWGIIGCVVALAAWLPGGRHALGFAGSLPVLALLGLFAGMFAVPVQVFLQTRPPAGQKGRMIATMNLTNFIAILLSGVIYSGLDGLVQVCGWPRSAIFAFLALILLPWLVVRLPWEDRQS